MNKISQEKVQEYLQYLQAHIGAVQKSYTEYVRPIIQGEDQKLIPYLDETLPYHDKTKYDPFIFVAYLNHWYLNDKNPEAYSNAVNKHIHSEPHHWEYWLDQNNSFIPKEEIQCPEGMDYIEFVKASYLEMLCDWFSFNFLEHHTDDAQKFHEWWAENKSTIIILPELNEWFTNYVNLLINKSQDIKQMSYQEPVEEDDMDWLTDDVIDDIRHNADNQITLNKQFTLVIDDEYEAIKGYDTFLETVKPLVDTNKYNQMFSVINHIRAEEKEHIEELQKLQSEIS